MISTKLLICTLRAACMSNYFIYYTHKVNTLTQKINTLSVFCVWIRVQKNLIKF